MVENKCRSGCRTKNHQSWGECARAARLNVAPGESSPGFHYNKGHYTHKEWDSELGAYRAARADGIHPEGTTKEKIEAAVQVSEVIGKPYDAGTMPPTSMLLQKETATKSAEYGLV